jgi:hypothetical protein
MENNANGRPTNNGNKIEEMNIRRASVHPTTVWEKILRSPTRIQSTKSLHLASGFSINHGSYSNGLILLIKYS